MKGKSCRFSMTDSSFVKLLDITPHSLQVSLMSSRDIILATGIVNDNERWKRYYLDTFNERSCCGQSIKETYLIHLLEDNSNDALGHVIMKVKLIPTEQPPLPLTTISGNNGVRNNEATGHASDTNNKTATRDKGQTIASKSSSAFKAIDNDPDSVSRYDTDIDSRANVDIDPRVSTDIDLRVNADIDSVTGQAVSGVKYYLSNTWFPPPLHFTATRSISNTSLSSTEMEEATETRSREGRKLENQRGQKKKEVGRERRGREGVMPTGINRAYGDESLHWAALMEGNPNSCPWKNSRSKSPNVCQSAQEYCLNKTQSTSTTQASLPPAPLPPPPPPPLALLGEGEFPVLSALCDELMQLRQILSRTREDNEQTSRGRKTPLTERVSREVQTEPLPITKDIVTETSNDKDDAMKESRADTLAVVSSNTLINEEERGSKAQSKPSPLREKKSKPIESPSCRASSLSPLVLNASTMRDNVSKDNILISPPFSSSSSPSPLSGSQLPTIIEPSQGFNASSSSSSSLDVVQSKQKRDFVELSRPRSTESLPASRGGEVKSFLHTGSNLGQRIYLASSLQSLGQMSTDQGEREDEEDEREEEEDERWEEGAKAEKKQEGGRDTVNLNKENNQRKVMKEEEENQQLLLPIDNKLSDSTPSSIQEEIESYNYSDDFESDYDDDNDSEPTSE